jgi:hypothetical protein
MLKIPRKYFLRKSILVEHYKSKSIWSPLNNIPDFLILKSVIIYIKQLVGLLEEGRNGSGLPLDDE